MKQKVITVRSALFGLLYINGGLDKFFHYMPMPEEMPEKTLQMMKTSKQIGRLITLVGLGEVLGGVLFLFPKTRALGAIVIFPITPGIMASHIHTDPTGLPVALVLFAINIWVLIENRAKFLPMIHSSYIYLSK